MGTTADKLAYLNDTKTAIKNAIIAKGVAVPDGTTFRAYADKISNIQDVSSLPTQGAKTVTPTTTEQIAVASGRYTTGDVKVAGDANLVSENIADGVSIFGVTGTHSSGFELLLTVSVDTGAFVTASKGSLSVTGTSVNGSCVLVIPEAGAWSVIATLNGQTSNEKTVNVTNNYSVSLKIVSSTLNNNDWDTISEVSDAGEGANYWSIGDRKQITLNGTVGKLTLSNFSTYAFIIGFNHNSSREGSNKIHFQLAKTALSGGTDICFTDSSYSSSGSSAAFRMNTSNTNSGGWEDSYMRNSICGTSKTSTSGRFMGAIPSALRNALKSVTKYTDNTGGGGGSVSSYVTATTDYIFLLSEYEVSGAITQCNTYEANYQQQYAYYSAGNSKIKYQHNSTGSPAYWWLRSPRAGNSLSFRMVFTNGSISGNGANNSLGVAPGFCV